MVLVLISQLEAPWIFLVDLELLSKSALRGIGANQDVEAYSASTKFNYFTFTNAGPLLLQVIRYLCSDLGHL